MRPLVRRNSVHPLGNRSSPRAPPQASLSRPEPTLPLTSGLRAAPFARYLAKLKRPALHAACLRSRRTLPCCGSRLSVIPFDPSSLVPGVRDRLASTPRWTSPGAMNSLIAGLTGGASGERGCAAQLPPDRPGVRPHRDGAENEPLRDLRRRELAVHQLEDLPFAR